MRPNALHNLMEGRKKIVVILVALFVLIGGVAMLSSFRDPEIRTVYFSRGTPNNLTPTVDIDVEVYNPNLAGGRIKEVALSLYVGGVYIGHFQERYEVEIPAKGVASIPLNFALDTFSGYGGPLTALRLNGTVTVEVMFFTFDVSVEATNAFL